MERHTSKAGWPASSFAKGCQWLSELNLETTWSPRVWMSNGTCSPCSWSRVWMVSSQSRTCCFSSVSWMSSCFEVVRKSSTFSWTSSSQRRDTGMAAASMSTSSPGSVEVICCSRVFGGVLPAVFLHRLRRWSPRRWRCPAAFLLCSFWSVSVCSLTCFRHRTSTAAGGRALSPGPPAVGVASTGGRVPLVEALQLDGTLPLSFRPGASSTRGARSRASLS